VHLYARAVIKLSGVLRVKGKFIRLQNSLCFLANHEHILSRAFTANSVHMRTHTHTHTYTLIHMHTHSHTYTRTHTLIHIFVPTETTMHAQVERVFEEFGVEDFARAGSKAAHAFSLQAGPLSGSHGPLPHTLEPHLRKCNLPTRLNKGVVELLSDHVVGVHE